MDEQEKALYVLELKMAKILKENQDKDFNEVNKIICGLKEEKRKIYLRDNETINKVLKEYINDVREVEKNV